VPRIGQRASLTYASPVITNGRLEAASESKVKNAKQVILYALAFLCFSQKFSGPIFNFLGLCVFPCIRNASLVQSLATVPVRLARRKQALCMPGMRKMHAAFRTNQIRASSEAIGSTLLAGGSLANVRFGP
jgi:hypothetical protein